MPAPSEDNEACVESEDYKGLTDKGFSLCIAWSGIAGCTAYRIFAQPEPYAKMGVAEENECDGPRLLNQAGAGSTESYYDLDTPFVPSYATVTYSQFGPNGNQVTNTSTQSSVINEQDAKRKAAAMAEWYVMSQIGAIA
jgi:hypothetical protein